MIFKCPRCKNKKFWKLSDGRLKCNQCKHRFSKYKDKLRIKPRLLMKIIEEFLLEHSTNIILSRVKIFKYKLFNGLEGFWGYLKRKLSSKGRIRREKLLLYLGEYVWRYNYRKLTLKEQKSRLFTLIFNNFRS